MINKTFLLVAILLTTLSAFGKSTTEVDNYKKHFIGSSAFILANLSPDDSPNYYQLNYGYRITPKDVISIEAITWEYKAPLGIPYGKDYENKNSNYPGIVQSYGIGIAYKRFLWKDLYSAFHLSMFHQNYLDTDRKKIQSGFQLFTTSRIGYQFKFADNTFFIEPSLAVTFWPINTNLPESFQAEEDKWNNYFLFEPGLHFGINF